LATAEVPVEWIDAPGSTVHAAKVSLQFLRDLVKIRLWDLGGRYPRRSAPSETIALTAKESAS
jgi:dolichyl-phosphate beta-glucosyltransferase